MNVWFFFFDFRQMTRSTPSLTDAVFFSVHLCLTILLDDWLTLFEFGIWFFSLHKLDFFVLFRLFNSIFSESFFSLLFYSVLGRNPFGITFPLLFFTPRTHFPLSFAPFIKMIYFFGGWSLKMHTTGQTSEWWLLLFFSFISNGFIWCGWCLGHDCVHHEFLMINQTVVIAETSSDSAALPPHSI